MSDTKHTPGPWKFDDHLGCRPIKGGKSGSHRQAQYKEVACTVGLHDDDEDRANARLIAAAPELLKALEALVWVADSMDSAPIAASVRLETAYEEAKAAIAKARGETVHTY